MAPRHASSSCIHSHHPHCRLYHRRQTIVLWIGFLLMSHQITAVSSIPSSSSSSSSSTGVNSTAPSEDDDYDYEDEESDFCSEPYVDSAYYNGYDTILTRGDRLWYYYKDQHRLSAGFDQRKFTQGRWCQFEDCCS